jgi:hypothetical protein
MRKMLAGVAIAASLTLGACATDPTTGLPTINQQELASVEAQIQQDAAAACKFVPTVASVAAVIATFVNVGSVVDLVNQSVIQICSAVSTAPVVNATLRGMPVARLAAPVTVNGAPINGYFLR